MRILIQWRDGASTPMVQHPALREQRRRVQGETPRGRRADLAAADVRFGRREIRADPLEVGGVEAGAAVLDPAPRGLPWIGYFAAVQPRLWADVVLGEMERRALGEADAEQQHLSLGFGQY